MTIRHYLAMTAGEIQGCDQLPEAVAWMACHFSPYGTGLSCLPKSLPAGSILVLDDITPIHGHDPQAILSQLRERVEALSLAGVLLDLQRPGYEEAAALAALLTKELPCPVAVSDLYAQGSGGAVFLPPLPLTASLETHLGPWQGRELWLEASARGETVTLTEAGAQAAPLPRESFPEEGFQEPELGCHYHIALEPQKAVFQLWRDRADWETVLQKAEALGVTRTVGLYQQFRDV